MIQGQNFGCQWTIETWQQKQASVFTQNAVLLPAAVLWGFCSAPLELERNEAAGVTHRADRRVCPTFPLFALRIFSKLTRRRADWTAQQLVSLKGRFRLMSTTHQSFLKGLGCVYLFENSRMEVDQNVKEHLEMFLKVLTWCIFQEIKKTMVRMAKIVIKIWWWERCSDDCSAFMLNLVMQLLMLTVQQLLLAYQSMSDSTM